MAARKIKRMTGLLLVAITALFLAACGNPLMNMTFELLDTNGENVVYDYELNAVNGTITAYVSANTRLEGREYNPIFGTPEGYAVYYNGEVHENYVSSYNFEEPLIIEIHGEEGVETWEIRIEHFSSPIVHWTFDKGFPEEITPYNKAYLVYGYVNDGVQFEGFSGKGYLEVDAGFVAENFVFPDNIFSIDLWFMADSEYLTDGWNALISTGGNAPGNVRILIGGHAEGLAQQLAYIAVDGSAGPESIGWEVDKWHHIALVYDGSDVLVYLDGDLVVRRANAPVDNINFQANFPQIYLGTESPTFRYFGGVLDEVRIWNYALSEAQIKEAAKLR